jgi:hypothetical protein
MPRHPHAFLGIFATANEPSAIPFPPINSTSCLASLNSRAQFKQLIANRYTRALAFSVRIPDCKKFLVDRSDRSLQTFLTQ